MTSVIIDPDDYDMCLFNIIFKVESSGIHQNFQLDPVLHKQFTLFHKPYTLHLSVYINPHTQPQYSTPLNHNTHKNLITQFSFFSFLMSITKESQSQSQAEARPGSITKRSSRKGDSVFHGVRKRSWGRYVSEIRLPGQKTRIWLGSFESAEMAARAYDSAAFFLKGNSASLNFPEEVEFLPRPLSSSRRDIQSAASKAAHQRSHHHQQQQEQLHGVTPSSSSSTRMNENNIINNSDDNIISGNNNVNDFSIEMMEWWKEEECVSTTSFWDVEDAPLMSPTRVGSIFGDMMTWNEVFNFNDDNSLVYVP